MDDEIQEEGQQRDDIVNDRYGGGLGYRMRMVSPFTSLVKKNDSGNAASFL